MEKYAILLGYYDKQWKLIQKLLEEILKIDISLSEPRYVFAIKTQQFFTATEDLLKQIAKAFENNIQDPSASHKELLIRLHTEIPKIRPRVLSDESFRLLNKVRAFSHFICHAYDCELLESELKEIQHRLIELRPYLKEDVEAFREYVLSVS